MWAELSFVLLQSTRLTDTQTEGQTDRKAIAIPRFKLHAIAR